MLLVLGGIMEITESELSAQYQRAKSKWPLTQSVAQTPLNKAGFRLERVIPTMADAPILEAVLA